MQGQRETHHRTLGRAAVAVAAVQPAVKKQHRSIDMHRTEHPSARRARVAALLKRHPPHAAAVVLVLALTPAVEVSRDRSI